MSIHKLTRTALLTLAALAGGLLFASTPALAKELYLPDHSFGPEGPGSSVFSNIQGLAVDQTTGDLYVYNASAGRLSKFNAAGEPVVFTSTHTNVIENVGNGLVGLGASQVAIDESSTFTHGDIYVAVDSHVGIYGSDGASLGELNGNVTSEVVGAVWNEGCGVSVDHAGRVYLGLFNNSSVYIPTSNPAKNTDYTRALGGAYGTCNLAADGLGNVYVQSAYGGSTVRASSSGLGEGTTIDAFGRAIAVDPATNDVFVDEENGHVAQFDSAGNLVRRFATLGGESYGVAANSVSHEVYVAESATGRVDAFKLVDVALPAVNDQAPTASGISRTKAALSGTINPQGYETTYKFVYGPTSDYVHSTAQLDAGSGGGDESVGPVGISGLAPGATYHYALVAANPAGTTTGPDQTFVTAPATPPVVGTDAPGGVGQTLATLTGTVDSQGLAGTYGFEVGTSAGAYGPRIGLGLIRTGESALAAAVNLVGLEPGTTYHYRVTATNSDGTSYGADQSFTTGVLASAAVETPQPLPFLKIPTVVFPREASTAPKSSTNAQKLAKALKACKKGARGKRAGCERQARKKYPIARKKANQK